MKNLLATLLLVAFALGPTVYAQDKPSEPVKQDVKKPEAVKGDAHKGGTKKGDVKNDDAKKDEAKKKVKKGGC